MPFLLRYRQRRNTSPLLVGLVLLLSGHFCTLTAQGITPPDQEKVDQVNETLDKIRDLKQRGPTFLEFVDVVDKLDDNLSFKGYLCAWEHLKTLQEPKLSSEKLAEIVGKKQDQITNFIIEVEAVRTDGKGRLISDQGTKYEFANSGEKHFIRRTHAASPGTPVTISFDGEVIRYRQTKSRLYAPDTKDVSKYDLTNPTENPL